MPLSDDDSTCWLAPAPRHRGRPLPSARAHVVLAGLLASAALVSAACSGVIERFAASNRRPNI